MDPRKTLEQMYVDRGSGAPLHYQIQVALENYVKSGKLKPGDRLPTVSDLSEMLDVSLHTALKAVTELQRRGVLISKRGTGTIVAPKRAGATDIIMPSLYVPKSGTDHWDFHNQLVDGLNSGFRDQNRRISMTYMGGHGVCEPHEYLASLHARRADSVVAYRPIDESVPLLSAVGREMPVVSLLKPIPASPVHCVTADAESAICGMLKKRLDAGRRKFAYVAANLDFGDGLDSDYISPHKIIYKRLREAMRAADIQYSEHRIDSDRLEADGLMADLNLEEGRPLDPDTVVVLEYPSLFRFLGDPCLFADVISYTEYRQTVSMLIDNVSLIYFGLDQAAREAAALIEEGAVPGIGEQGRLIRSKPEVIDLFEIKSS